MFLEQWTVYTDSEYKQWTSSSNKVYSIFITNIKNFEFLSTMMKLKIIKIH